VVKIGEDLEIFQVYVEHGSGVFRGDCRKRRLEILVTMLLGPSQELACDVPISTHNNGLVFFYR
jgi:hypothetical protein